MAEVRLFPLPLDLIERIADVLFHSGRPSDWAAFRLYAGLNKLNHPLRSAPGCDQSAKQGATPLGKYSGQRIAQ